MKSRLLILVSLASVSVCVHAADGASEKEFLERYTGMLDDLRTELKAKLPQVDQAKHKAYAAAAGAVAAASDRIKKASKIKNKKDRNKELKAAGDALAKAKGRMTEVIEEINLSAFLAGDALDAKLAQFVVLLEAMPKGLAEFAAQGREQAALVEQMLSDPDLMKQMLVADGAKRTREGRSYGPAQYGPAMKIYTDIRKASDTAGDGVLRRLALAVALEHAVPVSQRNPKAATDAPATVDPVKRYRHYEKAYRGGELDPGFKTLSTWDMRLVVYGHEPDETLAWGRETLRNFRPDHIFQKNQSWRYVGIVKTDVKYGSGDNKYDRPELQFFQNILMNGGVCGRRAFFGRFMLRAFGVPTVARPSRGHAALARWTPKGWVVCLGPRWGAGKGVRPCEYYGKDSDFLATTQARRDRKAFLQVKRAYWAGDVMGEKRVYGMNGTPEFWNGVALKTQRDIIQKNKDKTLKAVGEHLGEADAKEKATAHPVTDADKKITCTNGVISIPAAAYSKPSGSTRDVKVMKSFGGGLQIFLPRFFPKGKTVMRGGTWKGVPEACTSGKRMKSGGYGRYENWGLRAAMTPAGKDAPPEVTLDLGDGVKMEMVYIKPGTFIMGGVGTKDGRFECIEVPKHEVTLTRGFYLGRYEVTQAQYEAVMGSNPSRSTTAPNCPVDNVSWSDALKFCEGLAHKTGQAVRLPTEAEWEYASRGGKSTRWFFGDDPAKIGEYAWYKDNADGKSHPVGEKKPNPFGLYDIYGNVCERIADTYNKDYYKKSPKTDPAGPIQGRKSVIEYTVNAPKAGTYALTAKVCTANYNQNVFVSANGADSEVTMTMPFTVGTWKDSKPVTLTLKEGENTLHFSRGNPPQKGLAVKSFTLKPVR